MPYTIYALDNEFATSTGSNVNSNQNGSNTSTFDYPPTSTSDLVITSREGDPSPEVFSVGDTYDISWTGMGGGGDLTEVVVLRSDAISYEGQNGHAIVFEGTDADGETVQLVWSPGIDLEDWYFDNFNNSQSPGFYTTDQSAQTEYSYVCFVAGTRIAVPSGTCAVEDLAVGDLVLTLDHGPQPLRWVGQRTISGRYAMAPVEFAAGHVDNVAPLRVSPQHRILSTNPSCDLMFGSHEVLLPARAFAGLPGVKQIPVDRVTYVHLLFDNHEIVLAEGVACESLLMGPVAMDALRPPDDDATAEAGALFPEILQMHERAGMKAARPVLKMREAHALLHHVPPTPPRPSAYLL